jgi:plastocyanin
MKRLLTLLGSIIVLTACSDDGSGPNTNEPPTVSMPGFSFVPFTTTIKVGGDVVFDFPAEPHNVIFTRLTGAPMDIQATINSRVRRTFAVAGTFPYDCTIHPGMSGAVVVQP